MCGQGPNVPATAWQAHGTTWWYVILSLASAYGFGS